MCSNTCSPVSQHNSRSRNKWEAKPDKQFYADYSLRVKGLPPTYASKSYEVWTTLQNMILSSTAVVLNGIYATENCISSKARRSYALV